MRFNDPAWRAKPLRTGLRVASSLVRKRFPPLRLARVPYDGGRTSVYADLGTPMGLMLYRYGNRDIDIELAKLLLSPGDVFVDGGANVGLFTLAAAAKVGATGKVIAIEPAREVRLQLTRNVALNRLLQVQNVPFALAGPEVIEAGPAEVERPEGGFSRRRGEREGDDLHLKQPVERHVALRDQDRPRLDVGREHRTP